MGDSETLPIRVLLPICDEFENDVFLNMLKSVAERTRMYNPSLDAIKAGMDAPITVKSKDMSRNWKQMTSESQQKRQLGMIGFWAVYNYPLLGKRLIKKWNPPQRSSVVVRRSVITPKEVDDIVFQKLKLRIIELNVISDTLGRLNHFVTVPASIGTSNRTEILNKSNKSNKMYSYEIDKDHLENCWKALQCGTFSMSEPLSHLSHPENGLLSELTTTGPPINVHNSHAVLNDGCPSNPYPSTASGSSLDIHANKANVADINVHNSTDGNNDSSVDSIHADSVELRKEIAKLTRLLSVRNTEVDSGAERLHVLIIKQKDEKIERLKSSVQDLLQSNQILLNDKTKLKEETKTQAYLINTIQKLDNANSKFLVQSERNLTASNNLVETLKVEITEMKSEIQNLSQGVAAAAEAKLDMDDQHAKLQDSLSELKDDVATKDAELNTAKATLEGKRKLEQELNDLKEDAAKKDEELKGVRKDFCDLREQSTARYNLVETLNVEITELKSEIQNLSQNLAAAAKTKLDMADQHAKLQDSLNELKTDLVTKNAELNTAKTTIKEKEKLQEDIDDLNAYTASMVADLRTKITDLDDNLAESEKVNNDLKEFAAKKDEELKEVRRAFNELRENRKKTDAETQTDTSNEYVPYDNKGAKCVSHYKTKERSHGLEKYQGSHKKARFEENEVTEEQRTELILFFKTCVDKELLKLKMKETVQFRRSLITKNDTLFPEMFPFYFATSDLILYDFEISFEKIRSTALLEEWSRIKLLIVDSIFNVNLDENWMEEYDEDTACFFRLAKYLCSSKVFETNQFFIFSNDVCKDPRELRNSKIVNPIILAVGESKRKISRFYIVIEQELLRVPADFNFVLMIDLFFKSHKIFNLNYFTHVKNVFNFLEYYVYGMKSSDIKLNVKMVNLSTKLFPKVALEQNI